MSEKGKKGLGRKKKERRERIPYIILNVIAERGERGGESVEKEREKGKEREGKDGHPILT